MNIGTLKCNGNVFLAPMAGITDAPFRKVVQEFGVSALWTEMISVDGLIRSKSSLRSIDLRDHTLPTIFQLAGSSPEKFAEAASIAEQLGADGIDINMGCPVRQVVSRGSGAALMRNHVLAGRITSAVVNSVNIPVTVKIRSGWDDKDRSVLDLAGILEDRGADALVVHCRPKSRGHSGPAELDVLSMIKERVRIPVIGNGGIKDTPSAREMLLETGVDGIMIGRGVLGRPWLPALIRTEISGMKFHTSTRILSVIKRHLEYQIAYADASRAILMMRKHFAWYSKDLPNAADFRRRVFAQLNPYEVLDTIEIFFGKAAII